MDKTLTTLLRSLQASASYDDGIRLLPTATTLLSRLSNPLNISLLASQLLSHPVFYPQPVTVAQFRRIFSVFYTAALRFAEAEAKEPSNPERSNLSRTAWTRAVIKGADENSPRWRHTLLIGGLLLGFESTDPNSIPPNLRKKIEMALVIASNLALEDQYEHEANSYLCIVWVLNVTFPQLSDDHRSLLDYNVLLPRLIEAMFFSREGLEHGYWLGMLDTDIKQVAGNKFNWSLKSPSGIRIQQMRTRDLVAALSPLSRLIAHAIENVTDTQLILTAVDQISNFSRNLALSWRRNKLSEVDLSEESEFLDQETIQNSMPVVLHVLQNTLFAIIICLRSALGRLLTNSILSSGYRAPALAMRCLHILRDTYFIAHRIGQNSSSQYAFVNFTAIDILNQYPAQAEQFLSSIRPTDSGNIPAHPLDRIQDLYFLNLAEHFTLTLSPKANEDLLLHAAMAYITISGDRRLLEIYEAGHSVLLAVFAAPQNAKVSSTHIPFYLETLLQSFPGVLSARQFRLAIKSIVQLAAPPSALSGAMPLMQAVVLDMLRERVGRGSEDLLQPSEHPSKESANHSEKSVLILSILDCLPFIPVPLLDTWLPIAAELLHQISNPSQRSMCQKRFWEVLSDGEMDVERAALCVTWWTSRGGKELVLYGELPEENSFVMSGGLQEHKL